MRRMLVAPDADGRVLLRRSEVAWLAGVSTETVRRWVEKEGTLHEVRGGVRPRILFEDLCARATAAGDPLPAHWSWLNADLTDPPADFVTDQNSATPPPDADLRRETVRLRQENEALRLERDLARADAENLDHAAMAYRDNWRRRIEPHSPSDLSR